MFHSYIGWFIIIWQIFDILSTAAARLQRRISWNLATPYLIDFSFDYLLCAMFKYSTASRPRFSHPLLHNWFSVGWCWLLHYFCTQALANSQHVILLWVLFSAVIAYCVTRVIPKVQSVLSQTFKSYICALLLLFHDTSKNLQYNKKGLSLLTACWYFSVFGFSCVKNLVGWKCSCQTPTTFWGLSKEQTTTCPHLEPFTSLGSVCIFLFLFFLLMIVKISLSFFLILFFAKKDSLPSNLYI